MRSKCRPSSVSRSIIILAQGPDSISRSLNCKPMPNKPRTHPNAPTILFKVTHHDSYIGLRAAFRLACDKAWTGKVPRRYKYRQYQAQYESANTISQLLPLAAPTRIGQHHGDVGVLYNSHLPDTNLNLASHVFQDPLSHIQPRRPSTWDWTHIFPRHDVRPIRSSFHHLLNSPPFSPHWHQESCLWSNDGPLTFGVQ